ncbi:Acyl carrier protein 3, mitochondrial [Mucuna pruriens]|uniref:Acyl carrier protein n=1 Tax=Mucuna pruriens TaxID=157652 RepID=A0A371ETR8_MUCPR|nr:Acyl carrier protein 3, mitochondrial [Mucuna pruriens]
MLSIRKSILTRVNLRRSTEGWFLARDEGANMQLRRWGSSTAASSELILDRVVALAKKYDKIDSSKVTETADFQKDLNLDSLDRVELIMALEEEFSIEIPDEKADKLASCADVAKYIAEADQKNLYLHRTHSYLSELFCPNAGDASRKTKQKRSISRFLSRSQSKDKVFRKVVNMLSTF